MNLPIDLRPSWLRRTENLITLPEDKVNGYWQGFGGTLDIAARLVVSKWRHTACLRQTTTGTPATQAARVKLIVTVNSNEENTKEDIVKFTEGSLINELICSSRLDDPCVTTIWFPSRLYLFTSRRGNQEKHSRTKSWLRGRGCMKIEDGRSSYQKYLLSLGWLEARFKLCVRECCPHTRWNCNID